MLVNLFGPGCGSYSRLPAEPAAGLKSPGEEEPSFSLSPGLSSELTEATYRLSCMTIQVLGEAVGWLF